MEIYIGLKLQRKVVEIAWITLWLGNVRQNIGGYIGIGLLNMVQSKSVCAEDSSIEKSL